jgi:hypothetical protein
MRARFVSAIRQASIRRVDAPLRRRLIVSRPTTMNVHEGISTLFARGKCLGNIILALLTFSPSCKDDLSPDAGTPPSSEIILVRPVDDSLHPTISGDYKLGIWVREKIYCVGPLRQLTLDQNFHVSRDTIVDLYSGFWYLSADTSGDRLLAVQSQYYDVFTGALFELDTRSWSRRRLRDSTYNISTACYAFHDSAILYYSYGNPNIGYLAGYYLLDRVNLTDSLVLRFDSPVGAYEAANGFDISRDSRKLAFPLHSWTRPPMILEFDLVTGALDTLPVSFQKQFLWLRFDPTGTRILYSNYARGSGGIITADTSEVGVISLRTMTKFVLPVNPWPATPSRLGSVSMFPDWSPDGKNICYGNSPGPNVEPPGTIGDFALYILTNAGAVNCQQRNTPCW